MDKSQNESLLNRYRPLMIRHARRWAVCGFDDALQEAHLAVIQAIRTYDPEIGCFFGTYLQQKVRAHLRTWGRREMRWRDRYVTASGSRDEEGDPSPVEEWAAPEHANERGIEWEGWMCHLSPRERLVLEKQYDAGFALQEIADQEQVSIHTVRTWKKRAMHKLRRTAAKHAAHIR